MEAGRFGQMWDDIDRLLLLSGWHRCDFIALFLAYARHEAPVMRLGKKGTEVLHEVWHG